MKNRFLVVLILLSLLPGCARNPKPPVLPVPPAQPGSLHHTVQRGQTLYRIAKTYNVDVSDLMRSNGIYNPSELEPGRRLVIPRFSHPKAVPTIHPGRTEEMRRLIGPKNYRSPWRTITVHHSATHNGSARVFDRDHRRRKMGGLFYHFVVGNGSNTPDGLVEVGWRWKRQVNSNRPNDINICMVGNFSEERLSEEQFAALTALIRALMDQNNVSLRNVRQHCDIPGKKTECPGKHFPFKRLKSALSR